MNNPTHLSLFSGIGGIDLAAEWAGFKTIGQVEINPYCIKVLEKHFPDVKRWNDVRKLSGKEIIRTVGRPDLISGGFPCQPHSTAGKRKASCDDRDLWPEFRRIVCEVKPRWVLGENVAGLRSSEAGRFFGGILGDLAAMGYSVGWGSWEAADIGAPHHRERIFIIAHCNNTGSGTPGDDNIGYRQEDKGELEGFPLNRSGGSDCDVTNTQSDRCVGGPASERREESDRFKRGKMGIESIGQNCITPNAPVTGEMPAQFKGQRDGIEQDNLSFTNPSIKRIRKLSVRKRGSQQTDTDTIGTDSNAPNTQYLRCNDGVLKGQGVHGQQTRDETGAGDQSLANSDNQGLQRCGNNGERASQCTPWQGTWQESWFEVATRLCRVDDGVSNRVHRLTALGNAVVPQQVYPILKAIADYEKGDCVNNRA